MKENQVVQLQDLKEALTELVEERPEIFKNLLTEIIRERILQLSTDKEARKKEIESLIREDFEKYGDVYRALARS
jgi:hypothetical protein